MKYLIPKIVRPLDLAEYAPELKGHTVVVWVNPDRAFVTQRDELIEQYNLKLDALKDNPEGIEEFKAYTFETFLPGIFGWFAKLWSQGAEDDTHWTVEEIRELEDADPALAEFMKRRSMQMIQEHRAKEKKS